MKPQVLVPIVLVVAVVVIGAWSSLYTISEHEQAIVVQFGEHRRTVTEAGLNVRTPFVQTVHRFERRVLLHDGEPSEYLTRDRKRVLVDHVTLWRIADPLVFYQRVRTEAAARNRLDEIVSSRLREEVARHEFLDLIRQERDAIMDSVTTEVVERTERLGIEVINTRIKRADLPREVQASVFARMEAERDRIAQRYRGEGEERAEVIRADADEQAVSIVAEAERASLAIRGDADATATAIFADAFGQDEEFFAFWRRLETYESILSERTNLVLTSDSDLLRYLHQAAPPVEPTAWDEADHNEQSAE